MSVARYIAFILAVTIGAGFVMTSPADMLLVFLIAVALVVLAILRQRAGAHKP